MAASKSVSPVSHAYVFGMSPEGDPVLAGEITLERTLGRFRYDERWLSYKHNYPLDPVNLPLQPGGASCRHNDRVFPVFSDAAPDAWGTRIMLLHHNSQPQNELERLLRTSGRGVGSLQFSLSRSRPKWVEASQDIALLERLHQVAESIEGSQRPDPEALRLIQPGSSMGGARPKVTVHDGQTEYLAKFSRPDDLVDVPRVEFATMRMLADTALEVPAVRLEAVGKGHSAYLIERFDTQGQRTTRHYVSAHALFNTERIRQVQDGHRDPAGYVALGHHLRSHSEDFVQAGQQLFLRALTNVALGNTDDHARNFGMAYDLKSRQWRLAPVFDVLPVVSSTASEQAMTLGVHGRQSSWENLASCANTFGLSDEHALTLARAHLGVLALWREHFREAGVTDRDMALLEQVVGPRLQAAIVATAPPGPCS